MNSKSQQPAWMRATQLAAALCLAATPALAQMDGAVTTEPQEPDMGIEEGEEGAFDEAAPDEAAPGEDVLGAEPEPFEESEPMQEEQPIEEGSEELGDEGAMLPGGLDEMGTDEQAQQSFTGQVRAVDLEAGTVEIEAEEAGMVSLKGEANQLQELEPGQNISLTYEDREDGRWISEIQEPKSEPAAEEQVEGEKTEAESVQQPTGKRMGEGQYGTRAEKAEDHGEDEDEEKAEESQPALEEEAAHGAEGKDAKEHHAADKADTEAMKSEKDAEEAEKEAEKADEGAAEESEPAMEESPESASIADDAKKAEEQAKKAEEHAKTAEEHAKKAEQQAKKAEQQARKATRGARQGAKGTSAQMEMAPEGRKGKSAREGKAEDTAAGMSESGLAGFGSDIQRDLQDEPMTEQGAREVESFGAKDDPTGLGIQGAGPSFGGEPDTGEPEGATLP